MNSNVHTRICSILYPQKKNPGAPKYIDFRSPNLLNYGTHNIFISGIQNKLNPRAKIY
jgi:hypothetical protein